MSILLDNRLVDRQNAPAYYQHMAGIAFRDRVLVAMDERGMSKADLSRVSGVPYHAIDKFLKRDNASTSADNAISIARALGIKVDEEGEYEELRSLFFRLSEAQREFLLASVRGLVSQDHD